MPLIVHSGNKQYIADFGQILILDRLPADIDSQIELPVIHTFGGTKSVSSVKATVVSHQKGEKIRVVKFKSKSNYHRQYGFRAAETVVKIEGGEPVKSVRQAKTDTTSAETSTKATPKKKSAAKSATKSTTKAKSSPKKSTTTK